MVTNLAYGQIGGLSASTNKGLYEPGDIITITGKILQLTDENPVTMIVRNPIGNVYEVGQVKLAGNAFAHSFVLGDDAQGGTYTVNVRQDDKTAQVQFRVVAGQVQTISVFDNEIRVSGKNTNMIKYGNVEISPADSSLTIQVNASKIATGSVIEQYHIPKRVIDTSGVQLIVKENGIPAECAQTDADVEWILDCPINADVHDITLIGTFVIPEFGPTSSTILAMGIMMLLLFFTRNRFSSKY